jgi:hypothetical protein
MFTRVTGVVKKKKKVVTSAPLPPLPDDDDVVLMPPPLPRSPGNVKDSVYTHKKVMRDFMAEVDAKIAEKMKFIETKDRVTDELFAQLAELFAQLQEAKVKEIAELLAELLAKHSELLAKLKEATAARNGAAKEVYVLLAMTKETKYKSEMNGLYKVMLEKLK